MARFIVTLDTDEDEEAVIDTAHPLSGDGYGSLGYALQQADHSCS